jgi:hypothetical protein
MHGYRRIAVIPSVNLQYTDENAKRIKQQKGYVTDLVQHEDADTRINWQRDPPPRLNVCHHLRTSFSGHGMKDLLGSIQYLEASVLKFSCLVGNFQLKVRILVEARAQQRALLASLHV